MKHCLIVDDSSPIRKVLGRILEDMSIRTSEAETRAEALEVCRSEMPDCIIVDWRLPDGETLEFLSAVRQMDDGTKPTVFYLTSEYDPLRISRAVRCGATTHLMKPFDRDILTQAFSEAGLA
jgi:two-component system chemotaxis response regulator CheY